MYTENTVLLFGKYKWCSIKNIPANYLVSIYRSSASNKELNEYIQNNLEQLIERGKEGKRIPDITEYIIEEQEDKSFRSTNTCGKTAYYQESDASKALKLIRNKSKTKEFKPIRYYLCDDCKLYHLTSKTRSK